MSPTPDVSTSLTNTPIRVSSVVASVVMLPFDSEFSDSDTPDSNTPDADTPDPDTPDPDTNPDTPDPDTPDPEDDPNVLVPDPDWMSCAVFNVMKPLL